MVKVVRLVQTRKKVQIQRLTPWLTFPCLPAPTALCPPLPGASPKLAAKAAPLARCTIHRGLTCLK